MINCLIKLSKLVFNQIKVVVYLERLYFMKFEYNTKLYPVYNLKVTKF